VNFKEYDAMVYATARQYDDSDPKATDGSHIPAYSALGLAGEAGEVVELVKKAWRKKTPMNRVQVALELGDVLWYIARMSSMLNLSLEDVAKLSMSKLTGRVDVGKDSDAEFMRARDLLESLDADKAAK
jgi:NTP pyrophosphatase (non-canonical NTP hydrolase)